MKADSGERGTMPSRNETEECPWPAVPAGRSPVRAIQVVSVCHTKKHLPDIGCLVVLMASTCVWVQCAGCAGGNEFMGIRDGETFNTATWNFEEVSQHRLVGSLSTSINNGHACAACDLSDLGGSPVLPCRFCCSQHMIAPVLTLPGACKALVHQRSDSHPSLFLSILLATAGPKCSLHARQLCQLRKH